MTIGRCREQKSKLVEAENLSPDLRRPGSATASKIGVVFLVPGVLSLIFSIFYTSQIMAFIGLGLTFWGALFLLISPLRLVESSLLDSTAVSSYLTIDRIISDLKYKDKGYYIPPYPKDVYLPEHLKGLKDMVVFISAESSVDMPSIEEMAKGKFMLENPKGICVTPPGLGLLTQIEKKLKLDFTKVALNELCEILPRAILENFHLAKEIEMEINEHQVHLKISDSMYKNLYGEENSLRSVHFLGCPLVSATACAIAKTSGKTVIIQREKVSPDGQTIEIWYRMARG